MSSTGADALYTPASRGITGPAAISRSQLAALCMQSLPRGTVHFGHSLTGLHEDSDGVTLLFKVFPLLCFRSSAAVLGHAPHVLAALDVGCLWQEGCACMMFGHAMPGVLRMSNYVHLHTQGRPSVRAKLVICSSGPGSPAARAVQGSPLGRGRVALLAPGAVAFPPGQPDTQQVRPSLHKSFCAPWGICSSKSC